MTTKAMQALRAEIEAEVRESLMAENWQPKPSEWVVVRSSQSGVWLGRLVERVGDEVTLLDARRAWKWSGAGSCSGLAAHGPSGGKIACKVEKAVVLGCSEVLDATEEAVKAWSKQPEWRP